MNLDDLSKLAISKRGEVMIDILISICNKTGEWPTTWTQSNVITLPKKGNLQLCQHYRTIRLISHPGKVMLKIILNRLQPQAEGIIAEEQAGCRVGRSTTEQIFSLRFISISRISAMSSLSSRRPLTGYGTKPYGHHTSRWKSVWQDTECSPIQWLHGRTVQQYMEIGPDKTKVMTNNSKWLPKRD